MDISNGPNHLIGRPGGNTSLSCLFACRRPGVLVLVNDYDWELSGQLETMLQEKDVFVFISTFHGGYDLDVLQSGARFVPYKRGRCRNTENRVVREMSFLDVLQDSWSKAAEPHFGSYLDISLLQSKFVATDNFLCLLELKRKTQFQLLEFYSLNSRIVISF